MSKILVVDHDQDFVKESKSFLESKGYSVVAALNIKEGEEKALSEKPDLIILDIMMEDEDGGVALAHRLKKDGVKTPILIISEAGKVTGYEYGKCDDVLPCDGYFEKPVDKGELTKKIESLVKK